MKTNPGRTRLSDLLAILAIVAFISGCATSGTGQRARDFSLRDLDGQTVRLSDHLGKDVVLISFWATWCVPCLAELPHFDRIYREQRDKGFVVLAISMDGPESVAEVAPTVRRLNLSFPVLLDEETRVVASHNPHRDAPFTIIIDRKGNVVYSRPGYAPGDEALVEKKIVALLEAPRETP
jgi:peroxiredoxin